MSRQPTWTEREAISQSVDVEFSASQITKLRKVIGSGQQKSKKTKTPPSTVAARTSKQVGSAAKS